MAPGGKLFAKMAGLNHYVRQIEQEKRNRQIQSQRYPHGRRIRQEHSWRCRSSDGMPLGKRLVGNHEEYVAIPRPDGLEIHRCTRPYIDEYPPFISCPTRYPPYHPPHHPSTSFCQNCGAYHTPNPNESDFSLLGDHFEESLWDDTDSLDTSIFHRRFHPRGSYERLRPPYHQGLDHPYSPHHDHSNHAFPNIRRGGHDRSLEYDPHHYHLPRPPHDHHLTYPPHDHHRNHPPYDPNRTVLPLAPDHFPADPYSAMIPAGYPFQSSAGNRFEDPHRLEEEDRVGDHRSDDSW